MPKSKFDALAGLNGRSEPATAVLSRPVGKRSNPNYKQYSVFLSKATQRAANEVLFKRDDGTDFSDLVQELLDKWLAEVR